MPGRTCVRFLIVTADDFGRHEAVNEAVVRAHRHGILTAASLMVSERAAADAVRRAAALPTLRVGLHLVLADGLSTLAPELIPALANAAGHMNDGMLLKSLRFFVQPRARRQLHAEIRAQFVAFAATGLALDHVNVHKHFHLHPSILTAVLEVGREFNMPAVRVPKEPLWFPAKSGLVPWASTLALRPWVALMKARLGRAGVACNDHVFGMASTGSMDCARLLEVLPRLAPGVTEIYLHPAIEPASHIGTPLHYRHEAEFQGLTSLRVRAALRLAGVDSGGFGDVFAAGSCRG